MATLEEGREYSATRAEEWNFLVINRGTIIDLRDRPLGRLLGGRFRIDWRRHNTKASGEKFGVQRGVGVKDVVISLQLERGLHPPLSGRVLRRSPCRRWRSTCYPASAIFSRGFCPAIHDGPYVESDQEMAWQWRRRLGRRRGGKRTSPRTTWQEDGRGAQLSRSRQAPLL